MHPAVPAHRPCCVKSKHGASRHADAIVRHHAQHQRAGGKAGAIDDDVFTGSANLLEQVEKWADLSAPALQNSDFGMCRR